MTRFLAAATTVHATAAVCDYLAGRIGGDDAVRAVGVPEGPAGERDAAEALNVVSVRLPGADAESDTRAGDPVEAVLAALAEFEADELVVAARSDTGSAGLDETPARLAASAPVPVVVVQPA